MTLAGQRRINLIWEFTQATIAVSMVLANVGMVFFSLFSGRDVRVPESITNALFLIIGFYFSRTNHAAIGGTGAKSESRYAGR